MIDDLQLVVTRLSLALFVGALIGLERTFHGRPAGFRTHSLVCLSSSLLMLLVSFQSKFMPAASADVVRIDPTRMAQGIMTGIGFLGAGVIVKERATVRGLTTAASIWLTAAIGITVGVGLYRSAGLAALAALGVLAVFGRIERVMPRQHFAHLAIGTPSGNAITETEVSELLKRHRISGINTGYRLDPGGEQRILRYEATIRTGKRERLADLAKSLLDVESIHEFAITPVGD